jgi:hypothetical protein
MSLSALTGIFMLAFVLNLSIRIHTYIITYIDRASNELITLTSPPTETAISDVDDLGSISDIVGEGLEKARLEVGTITDKDGYNDTIDTTYTWQVASDNDDSSVFTDINSSKAAAKTFLLTQNEVAKYIRVKAEYTDKGDTSSVVYSKAVGPIENINDVATFGDIKGKPDEGVEISAGDITDADGLNGPVSFKWSMSQHGAGNYTEIATNSNYKVFALTQAHVGYYLKVTARYTDAGNTNEVVESNPIGPIINVDDL